MTQTLDARGLPCPQPVLLAKKNVDKSVAAFEVWVDNDVSASNVMRFLKNQGYEVTRQEEGTDIVLSALSTGTPPTLAAPQTELGDYGILLLSQTIGEESKELGDVLMKGFLGTLVQRKPLPKVIALMNGAVFLTLPESSAADTLRDLERLGVIILVCGTCTKHFAINEKVTVGQISNMFEITESVFATAKPIVMG